MDSAYNFHPFFLFSYFSYFFLWATGDSRLNFSFTQLMSNLAFRQLVPNHWLRKYMYSYYTIIIHHRTLTKREGGRGGEDMRENEIINKGARNATKSSEKGPGKRNMQNNKKKSS